MTSSSDTHAISSHATTGQIAQQLGESPRRVREALAAMEASGVSIPRCGHFRYVPLSLLPQIRAEVARMKRFVCVNPPGASVADVAS